MCCVLSDKVIPIKYFSTSNVFKYILRYNLEAYYAK